MTNKKTETPDTDPQIPVVKAVENPKSSTPEELALSHFIISLEGLMNEAYQQSQNEGELQSKWADWCNALGDLWREVKSHA